MTARRLRQHIRALEERHNQLLQILAENGVAHLADELPAVQELPPEPMNPRPVHNQPRGGQERQLRFASSELKARALQAKINGFLRAHPGNEEFFQRNREQYLYNFIFHLENSRIAEIELNQESFELMHIANRSLTFHGTIENTTFDLFEAQLDVVEAIENASNNGDDNEDVDNRQEMMAVDGELEIVDEQAMQDQDHVPIQMEIQMEIERMLANDIIQEDHIVDAGEEFIQALGWELEQIIGPDFDIEEYLNP